MRVWTSFLFFLHFVVPFTYLGLPEAQTCVKYTMLAYIGCHAIVHFSGQCTQRSNRAGEALDRIELTACIRASLLLRRGAAL